MTVTQNDGESVGFGYFINRETAERAARHYRDNEKVAEIEVIDIEPTKAGILRALQQYAGHADNG
jgi:hypothetical protein